MGGHQLFVMSRPLNRTDLRSSIDLVHTSPSFGVPEPQGPVGRPPSAGQQVGLPRTPVQGLHRGGVLTKRVSRSDRASLTHLGRIPDVEDIVVSTGGQLGTIRRPLQADHFLRVGVLPAREEGVLLPHVTVHNGVVTRPRSEDVLVPSQSANTVSVVVEAPQLLSLIHVPELDARRAVGGTDSDVGGSERDPRDRGHHLTFLNFHQLLDLASGSVPQVDALVKSNSKDVVLRPVEEVEVVIVLHLGGIENTFGKGRDVAEVLAVLLVGNFVVGVENGAGDGRRDVLGGGGLGLEGENLGVVKLAVIKGVGQKGLVVRAALVGAFVFVDDAVGQVEVGQISVHSGPIGNEAIAIL